MTALEAEIQREVNVVRLIVLGQDPSTTALVALSAK